MSRKTLKSLVASTLISVLFLAGCTAGEEKIPKSAEKETEAETSSEVVSINLDGKVFYGKQNAPNTIVVIEDYECGACRSFHGEAMDKLKKELIDTGKAKVYFMNLAFISETSLVKALLGVAIEKEYPANYTQYVDHMFNLSEEDSSKFMDKVFVQEKLSSLFPDMNTKRIVEMVYSQDGSLLGVLKKNKEFADAHNIKATPSMFVNGKIMKNPFDSSEINQNLIK